MDFGLSGTKLKLEPSPTKEEARKQKEQHRFNVVDENDLLKKSDEKAEQKQTPNKNENDNNDDENQQQHQHQTANNNDGEDDNGSQQAEHGESDDDDEEEEIFAENTAASPEDKEFFAIIGAIEDFMVSDELNRAKQLFFAQLPSPLIPVDQGGLPDQEKYIRFKAFETMLDKLNDENIRKKFPNREMSELMESVAARADEVSEDVMEVIGGAMNYEDFLQIWAAAKHQHQQQQQQQQQQQ